MKKSKVEVATPETQTATVQVPFNELEHLLEQRLELQGLRQAMDKHGVDSVGKLDVLLSRLNQRISEL